MDLKQGKQAGFSLVELMIAVLLSGVMAMAVSRIYVTGVQQANNNHQQAQLNHNLRASLDLILTELKRAGGYSVDFMTINNQNDFSVYTANPFMQGVNNLSLGGSCTGNICTCVTYSYDLNQDGSLGVSSNGGAALANPVTENTANVEQFGFRLNKGALEMRRSRAAIANTGFDCTSSTGRWEDLTDPEVTIDDFDVRYIDEAGTTQAGPEQIDLTNGGVSCGPGANCLEVRNLAISITGSLGHYSLSAAGRIRVRNDRLYTVPAVP
ncbi:prepilin-type N-terminal cleavage/methylation domain-containing protein [Oceanospirillum beijerinckii]|uniref:prepilin-type N-terminal cleavage/methylation domain-containing protein n=1 Tax=Oceanospirillum beijerinckii TaxID=64976 RepID=UPI000409F88D|nr:prepilin-type N-terminal cleavage/methylation domain-containing protein [Oceanospirillum beijerinckii]